jgi:hypothetical protein
MRDGTVRRVRIEGVGCTESICSRTSIRGKSEANAVVRTWFDSIAEIRETTPEEAIFVLKDGSTRRLTLMPGSRVLYFRGRFGMSEPVDLAKIRSVEATAAPRPLFGRGRASTP